MDANYQKVTDLQLTTNDYGTVSGEFTAPKGGLLGQMQLVSNLNGATSFRVEEYKRPKFEVTFEPVQGSYTLSDSVKVEGWAKAYAGSNIDGAKVSYRVVRDVRFPYLPWWRLRWLPYRNSSMEIANGTTRTDTEGKFNITFATLPNRSIPKDKQPQFSYRVIADVVDITGETHTDETSVKVGYVALHADIIVPEKISADSMRAFKIVSENLNGTFEAARGERSHF